MNSYLVTGGAGFIGSHLVEELVRRKEKVRVLDNFLTGKRENIAPFLGQIEFLEGDIRDLETCRRSVRGVDFVLHQAALPSVPRSIGDPVLAGQINILGTLNMLWASVEAGVKRFVFASSSSVYGDDARLPQKEGNEGRILSPYALTKLVGENYCRLFRDVYGLGTISLRYFNVFGPRQDPHSQYAAVVPLFITAALRGERPRIFGDGEQSRDFTYVANAVMANLKSVKAPDEAVGRSYNIACGRSVTVNALAAAVGRLAGVALEPVHVDPRPGDIRHSFADISLARVMLGFSPDVSFEEGLRATFDSYKERSGDGS